MKIYYYVRTDAIRNEDGLDAVVYGIEARNKSGEVITSIADIFFNQKQAKAFARKCTSLNLSPLHLMDVIQDVLLQQEECVRIITHSFILW